MTASNRSWRYLMLPLAFASMLSSSSAAELNPAAVTYKLPDQIPWSVPTPSGSQNAVLAGDPPPGAAPLRDDQIELAADGGPAAVVRGTEVTVVARDRAEA